MNFAQMAYYQPVEDIIDVLGNKTQNYDRQFYRVLLGYNFCKVAAMMRTKIYYPGRNEIPVNFYGINLAPSGFSKGHSTNIIEEEVLSGFMDAYITGTFNGLAEQRISQLAINRAGKIGSDPDDEEAKIRADFDRAGELMTQFDDATVPAIKQIRRKMVMADSCALNYEVDEIGANFVKASDVLTAFLELYDVGKIKDKLVKNSADNTRGIQVKGGTPSNMMLYGTPTKLFDGNVTESLFTSFLEMGYARRCFFGYVPHYKQKVLTVDEKLALIGNGNGDAFLETVADNFTLLADPSMHGRVMRMSDAVFKELLTYQTCCEERAMKIPEHREMERAELTHRYFKTIKLASSFAFYDNSLEVKMSHLHGAIKFAEDSGNAFHEMMRREQPYIRLAKYIAGEDREVGHHDLLEDLSFYPSTVNKQKEIINMAMSWAYKNNVVLKKKFMDGIELFSGSMLEKTNLEQLTISHGVGAGYGYINEADARWDTFENLLKAPEYNWVNHYVEGGHRHEDDVIQGFDLVVFDIDGGNSVDTAKLLLNDYEYIIQTTKSHTESDPHYRVILPLTHKLTMDKDDYSEFMTSLYEWFPMAVDEGTKDRSRKWATNPNAEIHKNKGKLLDALAHVPKTKKNEELKQQAKDLGDLDTVDRWFIMNTGDGNRNNNLMRYAYLLIDAGYDLATVQEGVKDLNSKISAPLSDIELANTIMKTAGRKWSERNDV